MNEFWALVLGAGLATLGGILGSYFNNIMQKKNENRERKREAYLKILNICNGFKFVESEMKYLNYNDLIELYSFSGLYASEQVKKECDKIFMLGRIIIEKFDKKENHSKESKILNSHLIVLSSLMKKELNIADSYLKKIFENTLNKKRNKGDKNGN